jgi:hypothetical protein
MGISGMQANICCGEIMMNPQAAPLQSFFMGYGFW